MKSSLFDDRCSVLAAASGGAAAQTWSPQKNVEIVAASAPGGSNDKTARMLEHLFIANKIVPTTITVVNKPGGGAIIANTYVAQRAGDPHYLLIAGSGIIEQPHHRREHADGGRFHADRVDGRGLRGVRGGDGLDDQDAARTWSSA